jgi:hypothetical protein
MQLGIPHTDDRFDLFGRRELRDRVGNLSQRCLSLRVTPQ